VLASTLIAELVPNKSVLGGCLAVALSPTLTLSEVTFVAIAAVLAASAWLCSSLPATATVLHSLVAIYYSEVII
jgi:hypothetical protein